MAVTKSAHPAKRKHKEVRRMKRHWLRGVLLGVSLALLLAGGVALAQDATYVEVGKPCITCFPGEPGDATDEYLLPVTIGNWDDLCAICGRITAPVGVVYQHCDEPWDDDPHTGLFGLTCDMRLICKDTFCPDFSDVASLDSVEDLYGTWTIEVGPALNEWDDSATFLFAKVCEPEFVPGEPAGSSSRSSPTRSRLLGRRLFPYRRS
jgi:hypothetical protein